ncbi:MAG: NRDE family protein [Pseudomonadota bacterium]|nr:NRDE family protein [Pseudomonadota bacterium]
MCTILLAYRVAREWPVIIGNNRDEFLARSAISPRVFTNGGSNRWLAPVDEMSGGSWWACNQSGLLVLLTNRWSGLPPDDRKVSRGHLVFDLIQHDSLSAARQWLLAVDLAQYNPFNLLVLTCSGGFIAGNYPAFEEVSLSPGFYFIGNGPLVDDQTLKSRMARRQFNGWTKEMIDMNCIMSGFRKMLRTSIPQESIPPQGFNVKLDEYGTTSSTLLAFSDRQQPEVLCFYAAGNPLHTPYTDYSSMTLLC